ncbi:S-adenosylmethionine sensor upstream of mTORC1 isoform X1 [Athalia rosae]|uniref:S-adenosylmethionine sensor upstream of mTORC1 isoform X1 n=2 Tax=Athalia rosae TaxID=37344 RepID=UPI0020340F71|nr:S-adenosylmethionine sensor upstream of mTORC1 isoform X1 [Athalia rosae]
MASTEHKDLAAFIKGIHSNLRRESQIYGPEEAWKRHLAESDTLQKYAESMHKLATKHWAENVADPTKNTKCRIDWVKSQCLEYFFKGGTEVYWDREINIKHKIATNQSVDGILTYQEHSDSEIINHEQAPSDKTGQPISGSKLICSDHESTEDKESDIRKESHDGNSSATSCCSKKFKTSRNTKFVQSNDGDMLDLIKSLDIETSKVKLLDVGSCYNPFGHVKYFEVTAIDLAPSCEEVLQCDFLSLQVGSNDVFSENRKQVVQLTTNSFDTIVFCLLLEYLPSPEQRYACCKKAYNLLKNGGLLLIITPDSKHVGANARFMKSWRHVMSNLGFMRIKYEKLPHAHCLAFRKCFYKEVATRWARLQKFTKDDELFRSETKIFIPQDFTAGIRDDNIDALSDDKITGVDVYNELPYT